MKSKHILKKLVPAGLVVLVTLIMFPGTGTTVSALDASFQAKATATLSCSAGDQTKKLEKFEHNAPDNSTVFIYQADPDNDSGGVAFSEPLAIGSEVAGDNPRLFWSIKDVLLGPWEAAVVLGKSCGANATSTKADSSRNLILLSSAITGALLIGVLIGRQLSRQKK